MREEEKVVRSMRKGESAVADGAGEREGTLVGGSSRGRSLKGIVEVGT